MKRILAVVLFFLAARTAWSQEAGTSVFEHTAQEARQAYDQGEYDNAIKKYQELENQGLESAELYYNLGNAEFKSGRLGRAIAYYRWALHRAPADDDIRYNLEYSRSRVQRPEEQAGAREKLLHRWLGRFRGQSLAKAGLLAYMLFCALLAGLIWMHGQSVFWRWSAGVMGAVFLLLAVWACIRIVTERQVRWGVVVSKQAEARNGPGEENQVGFTVPEGREVRMLGQEDGWRAVGLSPEGYKGWIKAADIWEDR
ncbi:tetratricopeptide repeat protein [candidate division FCPU426 bacterium]|nr:tetratricopeptide repeat protein [candidate division FCPU426 bacterium]